MKKNKFKFEYQNKKEVKKAPKKFNSNNFKFEKSFNKKDRFYEKGDDKLKKRPNAFNDDFKYKKYINKNENKNFYSKSKKSFITNEKDENFFNENTEKDFIYGKKIVLENLESESNTTINKLYIAKNNKGEIVSKIISLCKEKNIIFSFLDRKILNKKFGDGNQGIVALTSPIKYTGLDNFLDKSDKKGKNFIAILDNITDPHNVGAIIRSAFIFGFSAVILPSRNSCLINSTVLKASSGAANKIDIIKTLNLNKTIEVLKENKFLILASDVTKNVKKVFPIESLKNIDDDNICIVLGSEGDGVRESIKKMSDYCITIPMKTQFNSLNVSCAASIIFYELSKNL